MSKMDDLRALREAKHARGSQAPTNKAAVARKALANALTPPTPVDVVCGHRAIGGKTCIRAKDHSEKTHRYPK